MRFSAFSGVTPQKVPDRVFDRTGTRRVCTSLMNDIEDRGAICGVDIRLLVVLSGIGIFAYLLAAIIIPPEE